MTLRTHLGTIACFTCFGCAWAVTLRLWMRLVATDPQFSWSGTIFVVALPTTLSLLIGVSLVARRAQAHLAIRIPLRILACISTLVLGFGPGVLLLPALVGGGIARSSMRPGTSRRIVVGVAIAVSGGLAAATMGDLHWIRRVVATMLLGLLLLPMTFVYAAAYGPVSPQSTTREQVVPMNKQHIIRTPLLRVMVALAVPLLLAAAALAIIGVPGASGADVVATSKLQMSDGTSIGTVTFTNRTGETATSVEANLLLPRNSVTLRAFHGFHIHANDNPANGNGCISDPKAVSGTWFLSADGHLKRQSTESHGAHAGDLPSLHVNLDGSARLQFSIDRVQPGELFDRAVILHAGADNYGNVPLGDGATQYRANSIDATVATGNTGNAGDRLACGVIEVPR